VPASIELQKELGDGLQVIFVEVQGASREKAAAFALDQGWYGTRAMWTNEPPVDPKSRSLPAVVLLGNEGQVLLRGNPLKLGSQLEQAIEEQLELSKRAPEGTPSQLTRAWTEFLAGKPAAALAEVGQVEREASDPGVVAAAQATRALFEERLAARVARARAMLAEGHYTEADAQVSALAGALAGHPELEAPLAELRRTLDSEALRAEREAAEALSKLEPKLAGRGEARKRLSDLRKLAETHAGTKAAARAARYVRLIEG
jgi:hypothetical protein